MEFACEKVHRVLSDHGITLLLTEPYVPEQNKVSERENHTVLELVRSLLLVSRLLKLIWHRLVKLQYMCYIIQEKYQLLGNLQWKCGMVT